MLNRAVVQSYWLQKVKIISSMNSIGIIARETAGSGLPNFEVVLEEASQSLSRLVPRLPVNFSFRWKDIGFAGRVIASADGPRLRLVGDLGPVPFSAESADQRHRLLSLVRWTDAAGTGHFAIGARHHLNLLGEAAVAEPLSGVAIVTAATCFLLHARPYLDLAEEQHQPGAAAPAKPAPAAKSKPVRAGRFTAEGSSL